MPDTSNPGQPPQPQPSDDQILNSLVGTDSPNNDVIELVQRLIDTDDYSRRADDA
jgi:hypothetical protein